MICHLVDMAPISGPGPVEAYRMIRKELKLYSKELSGKRHVVAANKMDVTGARENLPALKRAVKAPVFASSAVSGEGLKQLLRALGKELDQCSSQ